MKKFLVLIAVLIGMASCQTNEQKAEALVKDNLKKALYKPETYKPIETKLDSAFAPYDDPSFYEELFDLVKIEDELTKLDGELKQAVRSMIIYGSGYQTAYDKLEYQEAKEKYDKVTAQTEKTKERLKKQVVVVATSLQKKPTFIGYKITHNYRAENNAGNSLIGNSVFFVDKDLERVTYSMETDEYNQTQKLLKQLKAEIEEINLDDYNLFDSENL